MEDYIKAAEETRRRKDLPFDIGTKVVGGLASSAAAGLAFKAGSKVASSIGAYLSDYIPEETAIKGLSKIDPRLGKFVKTSLREGMDFSEVKNFLGEKVKKSQEQQISKQARNLIEQHSPELHQFIFNEIKKGRTPMEAGQLAQLDQKGSKGFKRAIENITKETKVPWASVLEAVYGKGNVTKPEQQQPQEFQMQQQGVKQLQGAGAEKLNAIRQRIRQTLGNT